MSLAGKKLARDGEVYRLWIFDALTHPSADGSPLSQRERAVF
jgi:hypothetical protein